MPNNITECDLEQHRQQLMHVVYSTTVVKRKKLRKHIGTWPAISLVFSYTVPYNAPAYTIWFSKQ